MNPSQWRRVSIVLFASSLLLFGLLQALPFYTAPQSVVYKGPAVPYGPGDTVVSGYYVPPVDARTKVSVTIDDFRPGALDISIFPTQVGDIAPAGVPVYVKTPIINQTATFSVNASQPYGIYVISRNFTGFTLIIGATYSPFYWLPTYSSVAVIFVFAAGVLFYYYSFTSKRWAREQNTIREATGGQAR
jgi:hypothetical protein